MLTASGRVLPDMARAPLVRYGGVAGAVLLAVASWFGGAMPELPHGGTPGSIARGPWGWLVLGGWLVGTGLLVGCWWRLRADPPTLRWSYVTCALWALPLLVTRPTGSRDVYAYACQGAVFAAGGDPYRDGVAGLPCQWLDSVSLIWRDTPAPYGPLFLLLAAAAVKLGGGLTGTVAVLRLIGVAGAVLTAATLPVLARRCGTDERRVLWLVLACPLVLVHLVAGGHNDGLMTGLVVGGLAVALSARSGPAAGGAGSGRVAPARPGRMVPTGRGAALLVLAGALLGLAATVKATAVVVLPFAALALVGVRPRRWVDALRGSVALGAGVALAVGAGTAVSGLGFGWVGGLLRSGDSVQWTSPPTAVGLTVEFLSRPVAGDVDALPVVRIVAVAALAVVLALWWWRVARPADPPPTPARICAGAGVALVLTVAFAPVFHPWYLIWPLAVLAAGRADAGSTPLRQLVALCAAASFLVLPDGTNLARFTRTPGALAVTAVLGFVLVTWVRRRPGARNRPARRAPVS